MMQQGNIWDEASGYDAFEEEDAISGEGILGADTATAPAAVTPALEGDGRPDDDARRLAKLFESMPTRRKVLLGVLDLCREPRPAEGFDERVDELQERNQSVFSGATLLTLLQQAGGLRRINEDGSPYEAAEERGEGEGACCEDGPRGGGEIPASGGGQGQDGTAAPEEDEVQFLQVEMPAPTFWVTTEAGLAALQADDPRARMDRLFEEDAEFLPVYRELLEALADGPMTKPQIDVIVKASPLCAGGRRLGGYFVDRLEKVDAIEWVGSWSLTPLGREALACEALYL